MGKVAVISKYKSKAVVYLQENNILREDALICCSQNDIDGYPDSCSKVIVLDSWYGFNEKEVRECLLKKTVKPRDKGFKVPDITKAPVVPIIGSDKPSNEEEVKRIERITKHKLPKNIAKQPMTPKEAIRVPKKVSKKVTSKSKKK